MTLFHLIPIPTIPRQHIQVISWVKTGKYWRYSESVTGQADTRVTPVIGVTASVSVSALLLVIWHQSRLWSLQLSIFLHSNIYYLMMIMWPGDLVENVVLAKNIWRLNYCLGWWCRVSLVCMSDVTRVTNWWLAGRGTVSLILDTSLVTVSCATLTARSRGTTVIRTRQLDINIILTRSSLPSLPSASR